MSVLNSIRPSYGDPKSWISLVLIGLTVAVSSGCQPQSAIETQIVSLEKSGLPIRPATEDRMVVAVAERPTATWFFKLTGTSRAMAETAAAWEGFLKSVRFDPQGEPVWDVPSGWRSLKPTNDSPMSTRFATFVIPNRFKDKLELVVSSLGPDFDRLANFNRWRGQLGLAPITEEELDDETGEFSYRDGTFLIFDRTGVNRGGMAPAASANENAAAPASRRELDYTIPPGWSVSNQAAFVNLRLEKSFEAGVASISVTALPEQMVTWEESVQNWLAETGSTVKTSEAVQTSTRDVTVVGTAARRIDLSGEQGTGRAVSAIMFTADGVAWFVKLSGPADAVTASREDFDRFLDSLRFKTPNTVN